MNKKNFIHKKIKLSNINFKYNTYISQPTISRDLYYLQKEINKSNENYGERLFRVYRNTLLGLDEVIKKL